MHFAGHVAPQLLWKKNKVDLSGQLARSSVGVLMVPVILFEYGFIYTVLTSKT